MTLPLLKIDHQLSAPIGFAFKSRQPVLGLQAVAKKQILLVLVHDDTSKGIFDKLRKLNNKEKNRLTEPVQSTDWFRRWDIPSQPDLKVIYRELARNIIRKVRAGV